MPDRRLHRRSFGACAVLACFAFVPVLAHAATPATLAIQGSVHAANGGPAADGKYTVTFRLYASAGAKQALHTELVDPLQVLNGHFKHVLGAAKKLDDKILATAAWLGLQVGNEPETARTNLYAAPFALRASHAASLACTGCLSIAALNINGDLNLGGNAIKAKAVVAGNVLAGTVSGTLAGDGSKLTGVIPPAASCPKGLVVAGIGGDGKLICKAGGVAGDNALAQASGGLLTTTLAIIAASKNTPKPIQDNNPIGTIDEITVDDVGLVKQISVTIKLTNSDLTGLEVRLYDPANAEYVLHKGKAGKTLDETWPVTAKPISGDLGKWVGKNPKGKWRLRLIDSKFLNNGNDGQLLKWSINLSIQAQKLISSTGTFAAAGSFGVQKSAGPPYVCDAKKLGGQYFDTKTMRMYYCDGEWRELLVESLCGNKIINSTENCDDGNNKDGDGCTSKCLKNFCGDGVVWVGKEQCDDGNKVDGDACSNTCVAKWKGVTFTTCGKSDRTGPSQSQCNNAYGAGNPLQGQVTVKSGVQGWKVPFSGVFRIEAWGAKGGGNNGGQGARVRGDFVLKAGETVNIIVGHRGLVTTQGSGYGAGGGGATWIYRKATDPKPLLVAAGGGGQCQGAPGSVGSSNGNPNPGQQSGSGSGGANGNGGGGGLNVGSYSTGGGGAGWVTNGKDGLFIRNAKGIGGQAPRNGAIGGLFTHKSGYKGGNGGFGGGGGMSDNSGAGGGGAGYNGGGGGNNYKSSKWGSGGGGGSYNGGMKPSGSSGANSGHGKVVIVPG